MSLRLNECLRWFLARQRKEKVFLFCAIIFVGVMFWPIPSTKAIFSESMLSSQSLSSLQEGLYAAPCNGATVCFAVVHNPEQNSHAFGQQTSRCFDEVVFSLVDSTHRLKGTACVRAITDQPHGLGGGFEQCAGAANIVVFGYNVLSVFKNKVVVPTNAILFNMEQVGPTLWFNNDTIQMLQRHKVWDYSHKNIEQLKNQGIIADYIPVGYAKGLSNLNTNNSIRGSNNAELRDIDVLLVGTCNERRCSVIQELSRRGLKTVIAGHVMHEQCGPCIKYVVPPVYGIERDSLISRSRILLNVHFYSNVRVFEIVRVSYYLANSLFVISENGAQSASERLMEKGVVFAPYENLISQCVKYLENDTARTQIAARGFEIFSKQDNAPNIRCPLFGKLGAPLPGIDIFRGKKFNPLYSTSGNVHLSAFVKYFEPPPCFKVVAIMAGYNEGDVLVSGIRDLIRQGCDVHYIDDWSSDDTELKLKKLQSRYPTQLSYERFPPERSSTYNWAAILNRKTEYASSIKADWIIHVDPDELRESPWGPDVSLRTALYVADSLSFNLVNFANLVVFHPVEDTNFEMKHGKGGKMRHAFKYFSSNEFSGDSVQIKAWKTYFSVCRDEHILSSPVKVDLAEKGGHIALYDVHDKKMSFPGPRLFPYKFFLRHYPIRSQEHGLRKVFADRRSRWNHTERDDKDWHKQYEEIKETHNFVKNHDELTSTLANGDLPHSMYSSSFPCLPPHSHPTVVGGGWK